MILNEYAPIVWSGLPVRTPPFHGGNRVIPDPARGGALISHRSQRNLLAAVPYLFLPDPLDTGLEIKLYADCVPFCLLPVVPLPGGQQCCFWSPAQSLPEQLLTIPSLLAMASHGMTNEMSKENSPYKPIFLELYYTYTELLDKPEVDLRHEKENYSLDEILFVDDEQFEPTLHLGSRF